MTTVDASPVMAAPTTAPTKDTAELLFPTKPNAIQTFQEFYPPNWPDMPFHNGEIALQHASHTHEQVMSYASRVIRPYLPDQHREFYRDLPFVVAAARDADDHLWATLLFNHAVIAGSADAALNSELASPDPITLQLPRKLVSGDALESPAWGKPGQDVGILGIDFATARRNRVNGRVTQAAGSDGNGELFMQVTQSFGNCPQYITSRQWWSNLQEGDAMNASAPPSIRSHTLNATQIQLLRSAETMFVATGYRGAGDDIRYGNDASHRGGPAGFIKVSQDGKTIMLPEFKGNNHFNSLGNLVKDDSMGITIPLLEEGGMLQLTGRAVVDMDTTRAATFYPGALRIVTLTVEKVNQVAAGALPIRWDVEGSQKARELQVVAKVKESEHVTSFYLEPWGLQNKEALWDFVPGQHLPIRLVTEQGDLQRTYSLSMAPSQKSNQYRISVKREPKGKASSFLHDQIRVGDVIQARKPAGDFVLESVSETDSRTVVLLSTGVGVTPMFSMLQHLNNTKSNRRVVWIHGARNGAHHTFQDQVKQIAKDKDNATSMVQTHVVYSKPRDQDVGSYDSTGRMNAKLVKDIVPDLEKADFYICGPLAFMASLQDGLERHGVDPQYIHYETF